MVNLLFLAVGTLAASLYVMHIVLPLPVGVKRLCASVPVFCTFFLFPFLVDPRVDAVASIIISTFYGWWANFKVLALCGGRGPLSSFESSTGASSPWAKLSRFTICLVLPVVLLNASDVDASERKHTDSYKSHNASANSAVESWPKLLLDSLLSLVVFLNLIYILDWHQQLPTLVITIVYCFLMYTNLLTMFNISAAAVKIMAGQDLAPHFRTPYLATSLQDFWGHRWNLVAGALLREAVYAPLKQLLLTRGYVSTSSAATAISVIVTFLVSGVMHEFIIFNAIGHLNGLSCEWFLFFTIHGFLLVLELYLKRAWTKRGLKSLGHGASTALALLTLFISAQFFFFPPIVRNGLNDLVIQEFRGLLPKQNPLFSLVHGNILSRAEL